MSTTDPRPYDHGAGASDRLHGRPVSSDDLAALLVTLAVGQDAPRRTCGVPIAQSAARLACGGGCTDVTIVYRHDNHFPDVEI